VKTEIEGWSKIQSTHPSYRMGFFMKKKYHIVSITVYNKEEAYQKVSELLHSYADSICLRVGYPIKERNIAIIFLVINTTTDEIGSLSGKLGQLNCVKVKTTTLKD